MCVEGDSHPWHKQFSATGVLFFKNSLYCHNFLTDGSDLGKCL